MAFDVLSGAGFFSSKTMKLWVLYFFPLRDFLEVGFDIESPLLKFQVFVY